MPTITGVIADHLSGLAQIATGVENLPGSISDHMGGLVQSAAGLVGINGTALSTLSGLAQAATTAESYPGTATSTMGGFRQIATTATEIFGGVFQSLPGFVQAGSLNPMPLTPGNVLFQYSAGVSGDVVVPAGLIVTHITCSAVGPGAFLVIIPAGADTADVIPLPPGIPWTMSIPALRGHELELPPASIISFNGTASYFVAFRLTKGNTIV